ncbi:MAG: hypothetical protein ACOZAL_01590 [Patescibacteria group bacterium]
MEQPRLNLYFREIVYHHPSAKKNSVCGVFSYEVLNVEEAKLGNLYLVGKISNLPPKKHKNFDFLIGLLASAIKREFYSNPQKTTLEALESALQSANIYLADFTKRGHKEWLGNLDFTCLAFSQNNIHIGQTGNMLIYLFRSNTLSNIAKKFAPPPKLSPPLKTFSNIASGTLEENDKLIITTPDILNITPNQKIKELLSYPSTEELYNFLKDYLEGQSKNKEAPVKSIACLLLETGDQLLSIEKKITYQEEIPEIIGLDLEKILNSHSTKLNNIIKSKITPSKLSKPLNTILKSNLLNYLLTFFLGLLIILFPYLIQKIYYETKINQVNNLIKRINEIAIQSELSLTYQDQIKAQTLLQQANALIATAFFVLNELPDRVKERPIQNIELIQENLNNQQNSINNIINIEEPEEIANLSENSFTFNPQGILKLENTLYFYELNSGFLYKVNLDDLENHILVFLSSKDTFKLGTVRDNALVLLSNPEKIYIYSKNDSYNTYLLKPGLENTLDIKDMTTYEENLYFLDTEKLTILKYVAEENILNGTEWLKKEFSQDLTNAQSLAINGSVYVLKADGIIIEYIQGKKAKEIRPKVSPILNSGGQLFTNSQMKNLYILDPANKRIIALNKKDEFTIQYVSDKFDSLKDFWVTEDEKTIYILNGQKVYRIDI